jgi:hypothetical protein
MPKTWDSSLDSSEEPSLMITLHLEEIAGELFEIISSEPDGNVRREYYAALRPLLCEDAREIEGIMQGLKEGDTPEKLAEAFQQIDDKFTQASHLHLHAIDCLQVFMDGAEDPELLKLALKSLEEGSALLDEAGAQVDEVSKFIELSDYLKEEVPRGGV